MQIINSTSTLKATTAYKQQTRRRSSTKTYNHSQPISIPSQQLKFTETALSPEDEKNEPIFDIVYSATTQLITPPPSPKSSPLVSQSFEANDRVLSAKRQGQLKTLMSEYTALKKEGLLFTDHTYNLIFDSYASLRRDGTPLTPMLKSKYLIGRVYQILMCTHKQFMMKCSAHKFSPAVPHTPSLSVPCVNEMLKYKK